MNLSKSQQAALNHITKYARARKGSAQEIIDHVLGMSNVSGEQYQSALDKIRSHARVALHFHPDRPDHNDLTVAEALLESGIYKSQFETKMSNGSLSAFPGGDRDVWENDVFGGAYHLAGTADHERPKYGALNLMLHPDGPSPRFGSCYLLLKPKVSRRCTFTYLDSHTNPNEKGTFEEFTDIMAALLSEAFERDFAIGEKNVMPGALIRHLMDNLDRPMADPASLANVRNLNHYIEAQVHGDVMLSDDVDELVADPSFKNTPMGELVVKIAAKYGLHVRWHQGFQLAVSDVPKDFRGPKMPSLADRISEHEYIDPSLIGKAARDLKRNPVRWADRGDYRQVLQELKLLWHVLVRYGSPYTPISSV